MKSYKKGNKKGNKKTHTKRYIKSKNNRKSRKSRTSRTSRSIHRRLKGGAGCGGEYAVVNGINIPAATTADTSFKGLSINDQMAKIYSPNCTAYTTIPGP